jgi:anthranilate/para-aminobenzoate synthase component II
MHLKGDNLMKEDHVFYESLKKSEQAIRYHDWVYRL